MLSTQFIVMKSHPPHILPSPGCSDRANRSEVHGVAMINYAHDQTGAGD